MGFFSNLFGGVADFFTGGGYSANKTANQNYEMQKENLEYQKSLQQQIFEREDTALSRMVQDAKVAGFNPASLVGNGGFGAGQAISTSAPQREQTSIQSVAGVMQLMNNIGDAVSKFSLLGPQIEGIEASARANRASARAQNYATNYYDEHNMSPRPESNIEFTLNKAGDVFNNAIDIAKDVLSPSDTTLSEGVSQLTRGRLSEVSYNPNDSNEQIADRINSQIQEAVGGTGDLGGIASGEVVDTKDGKYYKVRLPSGSMAYYKL